MSYRTSLPLHPTEFGKPLVTKKRKKHARSIRPTSRKNPDGSRSSHIMESGESDGKYKYQVNPTLFPNKDGSWTEKEGTAGWREAQKRGEVYGFKSKKRAEKFAYGSWKKGKDKRTGMKHYRCEKKGYTWNNNTNTCEKKKTGKKRNK